MSEKKTLVQKIMILIKGGDEAKLMRFEGKLDKYIAKQVSMRKEEIENLQEKVVDAKEEMNDAILNVSAHSIQSADSVESYCKDYSQAVLFRMDKVEELEEQIKTKQEEIDRFNKLKSAIDSVEVKEVVE